MYCWCAVGVLSFTMGCSPPQDVSLENNRRKKKTRKAAQPGPAPTQTAMTAEPFDVTVSAAGPAAAAAMTGGMAVLSGASSFSSKFPNGSGLSASGATPANPLGLFSAVASMPLHSEQASNVSEVRLACPSCLSFQLCSFPTGVC